MQCIHNGEVKVINLKKKLWEQILTAEEDLGDPTDPETGWDVKFKRLRLAAAQCRVSTSSTEVQASCSNDDEQELASLKSMDDVMPRLLCSKRAVGSYSTYTLNEIDEEALDAEFAIS